MIELRPVLVSIKNIFLNVVDLSCLNSFLVDDHLNICILVLRFNDFYVAEGPIKSILSVYPSICLSIHQFGIFLRNDLLVFSDL